jgi:copper transport protein
MRPEAGALVRAIRTPFSWLAGCSLVVAAFTGLVALGAQVASVDALLTTGYGESLIVKIGLMLIAATVGLVNAVVLLRLGRDGAGAPSLRVPRLMAIEAALGVGALLAAAQVTASAPARGPEFGAPRPVRAPLLASQQQDILVAATLRPNRVGTNVVTVTTSSARRGLGSPVRSVTVVARPQLAASSAARTIRLAPGGEDKWTIGTLLNSAGPWRMSVIVRRADGTRLVAPLAWKVEPADRVLPVKHSARRIGPIATTLQWVLLAGVVAGAVALLVRFWLRRRSRADTLSGSFDPV